MPFENILVAIDGSSGSRIAQDVGFRLSKALDAKLSAQYVVNRADIDLLISPEIAEEFRVELPQDARRRAEKALKRKGLHTLALFMKQSGEHQIEDAKTCLDIGVVTDELLKRARGHDLLVAGNTGRDQENESQPSIGTTVQRVALESERSVLVVSQPFDQLSQIVVGYDGSATANGALLMAERLAVSLQLELKVIHVAPRKQHFPKAKLLMQRAAHHISITASRYELSSQGGSDYLDKIVFMIKEGSAADNLVEFASVTNALLVVGCRGSRRAANHRLGKIASSIVRNSRSNVLIYR